MCVDFVLVCFPRKRRYKLGHLSSSIIANVVFVILKYKITIIFLIMRTLLNKQLRHKVLLRGGKGIGALFLVGEYQTSLTKKFRIGENVSTKKKQ